MTEPNFEGCWTIRSSTSRFFPAHSKFHVRRRAPPVDEFELELDWETFAKVKLVESFREVASGKALQGTFNHPKEKPPPPKVQEEFELLITLCPVFGPGEEQYLFGLLFPKPGREDEGTGVWVAEQKPPPPDDPRDRST